MKNEITDDIMNFMIHNVFSILRMTIDCIELKENKRNINNKLFKFLNLIYICCYLSEKRLSCRT